MQPIHLIQILILGMALLNIPIFGMEENDEGEAKNHREILGAHWAGVTTLF